MKNHALVFPGQASQYPGMGKELYQNYPQFKEYFKTAQELMGEDFLSIVFEGPAERLNQTVYTQPSVFLVSYVIFELLAKEGIAGSFFAGHSLGEYTALTAAGSLEFAQAFKLVKKRAELMQRAGEDSPGIMAAVIGLKPEELEKVCAQAAEGSPLVIANYNSAQQMVISGEQKAIKRAESLAKERGAKKVIPLAVSAAFHSPLMKKAADEFAGVIEQVDFKTARIPVVMNVDAKPHTDPLEIKTLLIRQMESPVLWEASVKYLADSGIDTFIEAGPGKVLSGLIQRIAPQVKVYQGENLPALKAGILEFSQNKN